MKYYTTFFSKTIYLHTKVKAYIINFTQQYYAFNNQKRNSSPMITQKSHN